MNKLRKLWFRWWNIAGLGVLIVVIFSDPPRLWFWLAILFALILYGYERAFNKNA